jgi:hypothetical protein
MQSIANSVLNLDHFDFLRQCTAGIHMELHEELHERVNNIAYNSILDLYSEIKNTMIPTRLAMRSFMEQKINDVYPYGSFI